jgi:DNA-binding XRE family transcriptional regulator
VVLRHRLRAARERAGLSQAQLAERASVSRQLVGAIEAGRHAPAVDAALRIAAALDASVEALFGERPAATLSALGDPLCSGTPVRVGRVGDRLVAAPLGRLVSGETGWAAADGVVRDHEVTMLPGADASALVVVGCDPVLGTLEALLDRRGSRRMVAVQGSSGMAVEALAGGRVHAALVHGPDRGLPPPPVPARRVHLARWRVGVAVDRARREVSLEAILGGDVALVQREPSASSQQALLRAARAMGVPVVPPGAIVAGHLDAARHAAIAGCAAVTFEPAARAHGLRFLPLESHEAELWIDERWIDHPSAQALGDLLSSAAFRDRVRLMGGYDPDGAGALRVTPHQERR